MPLSQLDARYVQSGGTATLAGLNLTPLPAPGRPTVTTNTAGPTLWLYNIVARAVNGTTTTASLGGNVSGPSVLTSTAYNQVSWSPVAGAASYDVYRSQGGGTPGTPSGQGRIAVALAATTLTDTGLSSDGTNVPTVNGTNTGILSVAAGASAILPVVPVSQGGTGAATQAGAWINLGLGAQLPSNAIEGAYFFVGYGHSYLAVGQPTVACNYFNRLGRRTRAQNVINKGIGGWSVEDVAAFAIGSFTAPLVTGTGAGTWAPSASTRGIIVVDALRNNAGRDGTTANGGTTAKARASATNNLDVLLRFLRASGVLAGNSSTAFAQTSGTWATITGNDLYYNGGFLYSEAAGSVCTITTPVGTDFDLVLLGTDSSVFIAGATYSITVSDIAGFVPITGTTNDQYRTVKVPTGGTPAVPGCDPNAGRLAIPLRGLSNAAHTVVITHTGPAGAILGIESLLTASPTPPTILVNKVLHVLPSGYAVYANSFVAPNASPAVDDIYNALTNTVIARFPSDGSIVSYDGNVAGFNAATGLSSLDGLHPNDQGSGFLADGMMGVLNVLPCRAGLNDL